MKVAILFDGASAYATKPDQLILGTVEAIEKSLVAEGNEVGYVPVYHDGKWIEKMRRGKFDLAFNMCEGIDGIAALESAVISVLELFKIPFTGASSYTTAVCLRKHVINGLLEKAGLPVPRFAAIRRGDPLVSVGFPAIVKPAAEDASLGVEQRSVVRNTRQLAERVEAMLELWDEVLVQRYVDGREVNVGILGDTVLPIAEIDFSHMPRGRWHIVTYQSKWATGSVDDLGAEPRCPARLPAKVANEVRRVALRAWKLVRRIRLRSRRHAHRRERPAVDSRGQRESGHRARRGARAHGARRRHRVSGRSFEISASSRSRAPAKLPPADEWALAQKLSGVRDAPPGLRSVCGSAHRGVRCR